MLSIKRIIKHNAINIIPQYQKVNNNQIYNMWQLYRQIKKSFPFKFIHIKSHNQKNKYFPIFPLYHILWKKNPIRINLNNISTGLIVPESRQTDRTFSTFLKAETSARQREGNMNKARLLTVRYFYKEPASALCRPWSRMTADEAE